MFNCLNRKARRKDREGGDSGSSGDPKLYLEAAVLERKLPEMDLRLLVELPAGLDYNEWLASHSKFYNETRNSLFSQFINEFIYI